MIATKEIFLGPPSKGPWKEDIKSKVFPWRQSIKLFLNFQHFPHCIVCSDDFVDIFYYQEPRRWSRDEKHSEKHSEKHFELGEAQSTD